MNRYARLCVFAASITLVCGIGQTQSADDAEESTLAEAYEAYKASFAAGDYDRALPAAKRAYELGLDQFPPVSPNVAALAMNYGYMAVMSAADAELAQELYSQADSIYTELLGPDSANRIPALTALASVQASYDDALASLRAAHEIHRAAYPDDDEAYAQLLTKDAELLFSRAAGSPEAAEMLQEALQLLEEELGMDSPELVPRLFELASALDDFGGDGHRQRLYFDRALEILRSAKPEDTEAVGDLELQIAQHYFSTEHRGGRSARKALSYAEAAHAQFEALFGRNHPKTALAALTLGDALIEINRTGDGIPVIENAIQYFEEQPEFEALLAQARRVLLVAYLKQGDDERYNELRSQLTRTSIQTAEYIPILKVAPRYPPQEAIRGVGGTVTVEFTVDEEGRVRDPVVVDSHSSRGGGGRQFHSAALAAVRQFRYIPRFENGVPVSVSGVRNTITFELER